MSSPRHAPPPPRFTLVHASLESGGVAASSVEPILAALARILALPASAPHYWLDVVGVRPDEMDRLADILSLHDVTVNDILYEDTQVSDEKFERFDDYLFVITDILNKAPDSDRWRTENCNVVVSRRGAACFRYNAFPALAALAAGARATAAAAGGDGTLTRARSASLSGVGGAGGPDRVLLAVLETAIAHLAPLAAAAADAADALDRDALDHENPAELLREMARNRQRLAKLAQSFLSKREILASLCSRDAPVAQISDATRVRLRAVLDQVVWKLTRVEAAQETLRGATQNLFALVNLRVGHAANETNRTIKQISLILAITTPLTLVASIFGMNVYPLTAVHVVDRSKEGWGLMAVLIALMVGTTVGLLLEARRRDMFKVPRPAKSFSPRAHGVRLHRAPESRAEL